MVLLNANVYFRNHISDLCLGIQHFPFEINTQLALIKDLYF